MNKYQEALYRQKSNVKKLRDKQFVEYRDDFATLQELVDKATPKKPIKIKAKDDPNKPKKFSLVDLMGHTYYCPDCNRYLGAFLDRHCKYCGQALDGSDK